MNRVSLTQQQPVSINQNGNLVGSAGALATVRRNLEVGGFVNLFFGLKGIAGQ